MFVKHIFKLEFLLAGSTGASQSEVILTNMDFNIAFL